jgi:hypothetical protein
MKASSRPGRRLRIDRVELDLRGITPATAEAAARALGPALARALASHHAQIVPAERIDAGRIATPASPAAHDLAAGIARRILRSVGRPRA